MPAGVPVALGSYWTLPGLLSLGAEQSKDRRASQRPRARSGIRRIAVRRGTPSLEPDRRGADSVRVDLPGRSPRCSRRAAGRGSHGSGQGGPSGVRPHWASDLGFGTPEACARSARTPMGAHCQSVGNSGQFGDGGQLAADAPCAGPHPGLETLASGCSGGGCDGPLGPVGPSVELPARDVPPNGSVPRRSLGWLTCPESAGYLRRRTRRRFVRRLVRGRIERSRRANQSRCCVLTGSPLRP